VGRPVDGKAVKVVKATPLLLNLEVIEEDRLLLKISALLLTSWNSHELDR
jgi:hypothetical protein|tara:strand:- start:879 stop:1028 length:150 start_codon:yes stop_codon:yes gene_type:complete